MKNPYEDIINLPHYQSRTRAHMPVAARAAQFAPFAALTGFDAKVNETARLTDCRLELTEGRKEELNRLLLALQDALPNAPEIKATYFVPDRRKAGGAYVTAQGRPRRLDLLQRAILLENGTAIPLPDLYALEILPQSPYFPQSPHSQTTYAVL